MNPELESYIEAHIEKEPDNLRRLERATNLERINGRMCSGHIQGRLLKMLTRMINPRRVLEMGTFTGYSALCIAEGMPEDGILVTIELEEELDEPIREALAASPYGRKVKLAIGDAKEVCKDFGDAKFDMIFIDADKRQYPEYYRQAKRLVRPGGFILADNTLWDGHVVDPSRKDAQTDGIRRFNDMVASDPDVETVILPIRDGISIIRRTN